MLLLRLLLVLASPFLVIASPTWTFWGGRPSVVVESGPIVGVTTTLPKSHVKVHKFLGVPFAAPPVRFQPAKSPKPWSKPYDASEYKPACFQQFNYPEASRNLSMSWWNSPAPPAGESEDCLNLNIWAPADRGKGKGKAVMVWLHGGSLRIGSGSLSWYEGSTLAANEDIIVVTINYRTGVFGFPGSSELPLTGNNLGFLDQRFALSWIQRNIAAFGGDPSRVTIAGESAGSGSVDALLFTPPQPLTFSAAIMQSGTYSYNFMSPTPYRSFATLAFLANCTGLSNITCLSTLPALTLKSLIEHSALGFSPVVDNLTLAAHPTSNRRTQHAAPVPILSGSNADDGSVFILSTTSTAQFLNLTLPGLPESFYSAILSAFPPTPNDTRTELLRTSHVNTHFSFQCPAARVAAETQRYLRQGSWVYYYNATFPNMRLPSVDPALVGVWHASEIQLVFGTYLDNEQTTVFQRELSAFVQGAWGRFIRQPLQGPGWGPLPSVGVLGGGVRELEIPKGNPLEVIPQEKVNARCSVFEDFYNLRG